MGGEVALPEQALAAQGPELDSWTLKGRRREPTLIELYSDCHMCASQEYHTSMYTHQLCS